MIGEGKKQEGRHLLESMSFSVNARVALQLGRESISSSITAIVELVKNAYDADATTVKIRFAELRGRRMMIIEDDGDGMTASTLKDKWMVIGTSNKVSNRKSNSQRVRTGEKGLGRLGMDRLCSRTRLQTITAGESSGIELRIDWKLYESSNVRLETVAHKLYRLAEGLAYDPINRIEKSYPKGTRLILMGLKDRWDDLQIKELHQELSFLISPFGQQKDFAIILETGGAVPELDGQIESPDEMLEQAFWKVYAVIDENGEVEIEMTSYIHAETYKQSKIPWKNFAKGYGEIPECGPLEFKLYYYNRDEMEKGPFKKNSILEFLKSNQGIRIYRDEFRVKPYGEPNGDGDWLRLAYKRMQNPRGVRQGSWRVGLNQIVGAVFLTQEHNPKLADQTNREGLMAGDALAHLIAFGERVIRFFESHSTEFERMKERLGKPAETEKNDTAARAEAADNALNSLTQITQQLMVDDPSPLDTVQASAQPPKSVDNVKLAEILTQAKDVIQHQAEVIERKEKEKNTMANLASLGILTASFGHETLGWATVVAANANLLKRDLQAQKFMVLPGIEAEIIRRLSVVYSESSKIETFAGFALGNVKPAKRKLRVMCIKDVALGVFKVFENTFQTEKNVRVDLSEVPEGKCEIKAYRIDWESIFANLIANAVWAMRGNKKENRLIKLSIFEDGNYFNVTFQDSGHGIESGTENLLFESGFSTRSNGKGEIEGTGMGLFIVKSFVEENTGGTVQAIANGEIGGAKFIIKVPKLTPSSM